MLLHMLGQIGFLCVALTTVLADVRLEMFAFLVLRDVVKQRCFIGEALVARITFIRLICLVATAVTLQRAELRERLVAPWMATLVRFISCVSAYVLLKVTELGESALADLASIGLYAQMDSCVLRQVRRVGERLRTLRTLVRLRLPHVALRVELQVSLGAENLQK